MQEIPGIPYHFEDPELLKRALSHRSIGQVNNERLEFLGDAVLDFVVSARLYHLKPDNDEGDLSRLRARVVRGETLSVLAAQLELGKFMLMGEGELKSGGFKRKSILADCLEAIFGAIYLDGGFKSCEAAILHVCEPVISSLPNANELKDPKTRLQETLQGRGLALPEYSSIHESGPSHNKQFTVECWSKDTGIKVTGKGGSRQKAQQAAARAALELLS